MIEIGALWRHLRLSSGPLLSRWNEQYWPKERHHCAHSFNTMVRDHDGVVRM